MEMGIVANWISNSQQMVFSISAKTMEIEQARLGFNFKGLQTLFFIEHKPLGSKCAPDLKTDRS